MPIRPSANTMSLAELNQALKKKPKNKYMAKKVELDGHKFDSVKESKRYTHLKMLEEAGEISSLRMQVIYPFVHNKHQITRYIADFVYRNADGDEIVEDVKGFRSRKYRGKDGKMKYQSSPAYTMFRMKKKMMQAWYGIDVQEI